MYVCASVVCVCVCDVCVCVCVCSVCVCVCVCVAQTGWYRHATHFLEIRCVLRVVGTG